MTLATRTRFDFPLHLGQQAMLKSWARVTLVLAGTGGGKTSGAGLWILSRMRKFPGEGWLIGFPSFKLLQRVVINQPDPDRETLVQFLARHGEDPKLYVGDRRIECRSGQIFFAAAENIGEGASSGGWAGAHVKGVWIDEFDDCPLQAYRLAMERTRMRNGFVLLTGTPRVIRWVRNEIFVKWQAGERYENGGLYNVVQFASDANPKYDKRMMAEAEATLPGWEFRRVYKGELANKEGGNVFRREWWRYFGSGDDDHFRCIGDPPVDKVIQFWDTAFKTGQQGDEAKGQLPDFSVCATWGITATRFFVLDVWRQRVQFPQLVAATTALFAARRASLIIVEDKASGQSLIQQLQQSTHLPVVPWKVDIDKYRRASAVTPWVQSGRVYLRRGAPWLHDFVEEHGDFPGSDFDDQVDTTSMALGYLTGSLAAPLPDQPTEQSIWNPNPTPQVTDDMFENAITDEDEVASRWNIG